MNRFKEDTLPFRRQNRYIFKQTRNFWRQVPFLKCWSCSSSPSVTSDSFCEDSYVVEGSAVEKCINLLARLEIAEVEEGDLRIKEPLKLKLVKTRFHTGQVVETMWNGIWHRTKIVRWFDESSCDVRLLDGDPFVRGSLKRIKSANMRFATNKISTHRYITIDRFEDVGFNLDGNVVTSVDYNGYAAQRGIKEGWEFDEYALKPSVSQILCKLIQAKSTYPVWEKVVDGVQTLEDLLRSRRVFMMSFHLRTSKDSTTSMLQHKMNISIKNPIFELGTNNIVKLTSKMDGTERSLNQPLETSESCYTL
jgi:hypothetical protein